MTRPVALRRRMSRVALAVVCTVLAARETHAAPVYPTPKQGADAVLAAFRSHDETTMTKWAETELPDPWSVADDLAGRGEHEAASAFAAKVPARCLGRLREYLATRVGKPDDSVRRKICDAVYESWDGVHFQPALTALAGVPADSDDILSMSVAALRGYALLNTGHDAEAEPDLLRAEAICDRLGMPSGRSWVLLQRANHASKRKDFRRTIELAEATIRREEARGRGLCLLFALNLKGLSLGMLGDIPAAKETLVRAATVAEQIGNSEWTGLLRMTLLALNALTKPTDTALAGLEHSLADAESGGRRLEAALMRGAIAGAHELRGEVREAIEQHEKALAAHEALDNTSGVVEELQGIFRDRIRLGELVPAVTGYERAIPLLRTLHDARALARGLALLGTVRLRVGDTARAVAELEEAVAVAAESHDSVALSMAVGAMLHARRRKEDLPAGRVTLGKALESLSGEDDRADAARLRIVYGVMEIEFGDPERARELLESAASTLEGAGDPDSHAMALSNLGIAYRALGDAPRALATQEIALALQRKLGDAPGAAATLGNLSATHILLGNFLEGAAAAREAIPILEASRDRQSLAGAIGNLGTCSMHLGRYADAMSAMDRAYQLAKTSNDESAAARVLLNRGSLEGLLGQGARAIATTKRALADFTAQGDEAGILFAREGLGNLLVETGDPEAAREALSSVLASREAAGDRSGTARVLANLGRVAHLLHDDETALDLARRAVAAKESMASRAGVGISRLLLADANRRIGRREEAEADARRALAEGRQSGSSAVVLRALASLAEIQLQSGHADLAIASAKEAIAQAPRLFGGLADEEGATARDFAAEAFSVGARAARAAGDTPALAYFLESGRAGALAEALGGREALRAVAVPRALRDEEARARAAEAVATRRSIDAVGKGDLADVRARAAELDAARLGRQEVLERVQRESKSVANVAYLAADSLDAVRGRLGGGDALVLYELLPEESMALVVTPAGARVVALGATAAIEDAANLVEVYETAADPTAALARLRALVIDPLGLGDSVTRLLVSPDGALSYLPLSMLVGDRDLAYVPSGTTYGLLLDDRARRGEGVLALGDPAYDGKPDAEAAQLMSRGGRLVRLPATADEAKAVGDVVLLGRDATEEGLRSALARRPRWRAVHLACHGLVDTDRPMLSSLALTPAGDDDGFLTALDVFGLKAPADLVVLSACETAKGKVVKAEGILGLARAFMFAGAPRVLVSQWKVDDAATRSLMTSFYERWKAGAPASRALRDAQRHVRELEIETRDEAASRAAGHDVVKRRRPYAHPAYWAAWSLWGLPE